MADPDGPGACGEEAEQDEESPVSDPELGASADADMELLRTLLSRTLGLGGDKPERVLDELSLDGVSRFLRSERCKNIVCMVGAGISTSAGIPDFRSPGTGLYANLQSYDLPYPEAIFEISFFKQNPEPFFALARELYPGQFKPTVCHYFMRLLQDKGLLLRCYTQNIDTLERVAGLDPERLVEAHGTFFTSHCLRPSCRQPYSLSWMKGMGGLWGPPGTPPNTWDPQVPSPVLGRGKKHLPPPCHPFCSPQSDPLMSLMGFGCGMDFDSEKAYRDVAWLGDCDSGCLALAELLGWKEELEELVRREHAAIDARGGDKDRDDPENRRGHKEKGDPKQRQGHKDEAQRDPEKPQGGSEKPPQSEGDTPQK
ncbi:PREDICTED: NAD-dependent protein deacetylase sirtuin-2 [Lepidothrix coronata]|uniref:NAD-dependent protein deacetylase sirtuin-2 n=1 Tax=Lepidothrix coronata TaxID=321398 RepID=A0A6J0J831_9PASS|nr:PREDICTED: NAD-dependent protein deacetylase sirtuin-2 [Lepidothrix coronata]